MPSKLDESRKKGLAVIVSEFGMSAASGNGGISTGSTGKWLKRLNKKNVSYFCWSLSNKKESCSLLASKTRKTGNWKTKDLSMAGKYIQSKYRARKKALGKTVNHQGRSFLAQESQKTPPHWFTPYRWSFCICRAFQHDSVLPPGYQPGAFGYRWNQRRKHPYYILRKPAFQ